MVGSVDSFEENTHGEPEGSPLTSSLLVFHSDLVVHPLAGGGLYR